MRYAKVLLKPLLLATAAATGVGALIVFRYKCMNIGEPGFVSSYCFNDNKTRTIASYILTVVTFFTGIILLDVVGSFRGFKLTGGINEGVFVALMSDNTYRLRSMFTRWAPIIAIIMFLQYGQGLIQPFANLAMQSEIVYVKNRSTASVYDLQSNYNSTTSEIANIAQNPQNLVNAIVLVGSLQRYSAGASSEKTVRTGVVRTKVVRSGYVTAFDVIDGDNTNSFERTETIATVSTKCAPKRIVDVQEYTLQLPNPPAQSIVTSGKLQLVTYYQASFKVTSKSAVLFNTYILSSGTTTGIIPSNGNLTTCSSLVQFKQERVIYTVSTRNVQSTGTISDQTTVDPSVIGKIVLTLSQSFEAAGSLSGQTDAPDVGIGINNFISSIGPGLFGTTTQNQLHSRVSGSVADSLNILWANYSPNSTTNLQNYINTPLYSIVVLTYMSLGALWTLAGIILSFVLVACTLNIVFTLLSPVSHPENNELALMYNADKGDVDARINQHISNDPDKQLKASFNSNLYRREEPVYSSSQLIGHRLVIGRSEYGNLPRSGHSYM